jgi:superfamily II DNA or RNA helicase
MRDHSGVFIASPIFDEGIDVPRVDTVILACGGKSYVKLLQRIGRGMRKKDDGKNELIIIDFIDDTNKYLLKHSDRRIKTYVSEGFDAKVVDAKPGIVLHKST